MKIKKAMIQGVLWVSCFFFAGCGEATTTGGGEAANLDLRLNAAGRTLADDRLGVRISGQGMEAYLWDGAVGSELRIERIPPGNERTVEGWIDDVSGRRAYHGEKVTDLSAGSNSLAVQLLPQFATLLASFPLGVGNPAGIAGGLLTLSRPGDTLSAPLELGSYKARFFIERLFYGDDWRLRISIWGNGGDTLYHLDQNFVVLPNSPKEIFLDLSILQSDLLLTIELGDADRLDLSLELPDQITRAPAPNEVLFSELMVHPKTSGDPWEWIELANLSRDTLLLNSCVVARNRSSSGATMRLDLPDGLKVAPLHRLVIGRDSVQFADWNYSSFTLVNTTQSLILFCGSSLIDSMTYFPSTDSINPFPVQEKVSMELDLEQWENRLLGTAWSLASDSLEMGGWWALGTPGK